MSLLALVKETGKRMAILLVYSPPRAPADTLLRLIEEFLEWALHFPQLIVLGDLSVHNNSSLSGSASDFMSAMAGLGLSQIVLVPTHTKQVIPWI